MLANQIFLGTEQFITEVRKHIREDKDLSEISSSQKRPLAKSLSFYRKTYSHIVMKRYAQHLKVVAIAEINR